MSQVREEQVQRPGFEEFTRHHPSRAVTHLGLLASTAGSVGDAWASDYLRWSVSNLEPPSCSPGSIWQSDCLHNV